VSRLLEHPSPLKDFRCACGYGAARRSAPDHCPMCGGNEWQDLGWKPFAALPDDFTARTQNFVDDGAANEPLRREAAEVGAASGLLGVPFA
jgi:hypothetical protein